MMRGKATIRTSIGILVAAVVVGLGLVVGGCGDSDRDSGAEAPDFAVSDLEALSFAPDELAGMEYQPDVSGSGAFAADQEEEEGEEEEEGDEEDGDEGGESNAEFLRRLQRFGLEGDYISQFFATSRDSELGFVESLVFLFEDDGGAGDAIDAVAKGAARNIAPAEEIAAPDLGDEAFGLRGEFDGFLTYSFGWQAGDAIQLITVAPGDQKASPKATLELAKRLAAKAEE